jgi:hypothetical protein
MALPPIRSEVKVNSGYGPHGNDCNEYSTKSHGHLLPSGRCRPSTKYATMRDQPLQEGELAQVAGQTNLVKRINGELKRYREGTWFHEDSK